MSVVVVTVLLVVAAFFAKRWSTKHQIESGMRVTSRQSLSRHGSIAIVEADGRRFLIGASQQNTQLLAELSRVAPKVSAVPNPVSSITGEPTDDVDDEEVPVPVSSRKQPMTVGELLDRLREMTVRKTG